MEHKSKISVIVVCYNQEHTIAKTLDSILEQKGCDRFEILVSDDCSTDRTAAIAEEYAANYPGIIKVHVNATNLGVQGNYFGALQRARGEYIADCAGDDFWCDSHKLARQQSILDTHPEVAMVHTNFYYAFPNGDKKLFTPKSNVRHTAFRSHDALEAILCGEDTPFLHLCTALYRKAPILEDLQKYKDVFLDPQYKCEDLQIMASAAAAGDVVYLPEPTLCYRVGHVSISSTESFTKTFDFYFATTRLRLKLLNIYDVAAGMQILAMNHYTDFLMAQAFHADSKDRLRTLMNWMRENDIRPTFKAKVFYCLGLTSLRKPISRLLLARRKKLKL